MDEADDSPLHVPHPRYVSLSLEQHVDVLIVFPNMWFLERNGEWVQESDLDRSSLFSSIGVISGPA